jgi:thiamine biosynthesis lipoprotein
MRDEATAVLPALGTTAQLTLADPEALEQATRLMHLRLDELDRAASRFRPDSELMLLQTLAPASLRVSGLLADAIAAALWAAETTAGAVDPTVGSALRSAGYDRDFAEVTSNPAEPGAPAPAPGWRSVRLDPRTRILRLPAGMELDLGATAKALVADRIAAEVRRRFATDVLVSLGGDVATAGWREWDVAIADDHAAAETGEPRPTVRVGSGGLATSSTAVRRWRAGGRLLHHIIDPSSGRPAEPAWRTVTVAARSCLAANTASTAAIVLGERAPDWLASRGLPARLVREDGEVVRVAGWPDEGA